MSEKNERKKKKIVKTEVFPDRRMTFGIGITEKDSGIFNNFFKNTIIKS